MRMSFACLSLSLGCAIGAALFAAPARAKSPELPQVLGLVASKQPVPLTCEGGDCSGFFTAFCMQEQRPKPDLGHVYDPAGQGDITIVVEKQDGSTAEFSAAGLLRFESTGAYTSVRISMDAKRLASLDAVSVALTVPPRVSLIPRENAAAAGIPSAEDLETATGEQRVLAEGYFENGSARADAGALMTRLINLLPSDGYAPQALRGSVWSDAVGGVGSAVYAPDGVARARDAYDRCKAYGDQGYKVRLRGCLETTHDRLMRELNDKYWEGSAGF